MEATVRHQLAQADTTAGLHFRNTSVPYACPIPSGLTYGSRIYIQGLVPKVSLRFSVNLQRGTGEDSDIFLHFNPRFEPTDQAVVCNSRKAKSWGSEEREGKSPFAQGRPFLLIITPFAQGYELEVNGVPFTTFNYREGLALADVTHLCINGNVYIRSIHIPVSTMPKRLRVTVPGKAKVGDVFTVRGEVPAGAERFVLNLQDGPGMEEDIALHINPRFGEGVIVRNDRKKGKWGTEESEGGMVLSPGGTFIIQVHVLEEAFKVMIDGSHFAHFVHRHKVNKTGNIIVEGDVLLHDVRVESTLPQDVPLESEDNWNPIPDVPEELQYVSEMPQLLAEMMESSPPKLELLQPAKPFSRRLPSVMSPGTRVIVSGMVDENPTRFYINLQTDVGDTADIGLHFNPRFDDKASVRLNSRDHDSWQEEVTVAEKPPFFAGKPFYVDIECQNDGYNIVVNKKFLAHFPHRLDMERIDYLTIDGSITIDRVAVL
uniref:Galectin n=1 Tax=Ornithodoros turicata TaxID=34597 RepID=A0A2R5LL42_9ACAR